MTQNVIDQVILKVNNGEYNVIGHKFGIMQPEQNGRPFGRPQVTKFILRVESDGDDAGLMGWACDSVQTYEGSIDFMSNGALVSQITFSGAHCIGYENEGAYDYKRGGTSSLVEEVHLLPTSFSWSDATYNRAA